MVISAPRATLNQVERRYQPSDVAASDDLVTASAGNSVRMSLLPKYMELAKLRIATMSLITVAAGYFLALPAGGFELSVFLVLLAGSGLIAAGSGALNHWLEADTDALMNRTRNRPIQCGAIASGSVFLFGMACLFAGIVVFLLKPELYLSLVITLIVAGTYLLIYTPLKRYSSWNTLVGAVPGALPPVIGTSAATGQLEVYGLSLFLILFVWQLPHFYSIAWLHRDDYARGRLWMLPNVDRADGLYTGIATLFTCVALVAVSVLPYHWELLGALYLAAAVALGLYFLSACARFAYDRTTKHAKRVLRASIVYLTLLMTVIVIDASFV